MNHNAPETIGTEDFAELAGIGLRGAQKAVAGAAKGHPWRGHRLAVRTVRSRGGAAGAAYEIVVGSLPAELRDRVAPKRQAELPLIAASAFGKEWRQHLVLSICQAGAPGSPGRGARIAELAAASRYPSGKREGKLIPERTLRSWVAAYEDGGVTSTVRARRADRGRKRVIVWREWDRALIAAGVPKAVQCELAVKIDKMTRSFWADGASSAVTVCDLMRRHCLDFLAAAGIALPENVLATICTLPASYTAEKARKRARLIHIKRTDASRWHSKFVPRIRRTRDDLVPMQMVAADVRHSDIIYRRSDGSLATAKIVAFQDLATNRVFIRAFLMKPGEMLRREHVLAARRDLFADCSWGIPQAAYEDNGGEFKTGGASDDLARIVTLVRQAAGIEIGFFDEGALARRIGTVNSRPYTPQSKIIESLFSVFTRSIEPHWPGYIGGNRMVKKVENQGKLPVPMEGDTDAILREYQAMAAFYNARKQQRGHIKGLSPNEAFAAHVSKGWQPVIFDPREFELAFGKDGRRHVGTGGEIKVNGRCYRNDKLMPLTGETVAIRVPILGDGNRIVILDDKGEPMCVAIEDVEFRIDDLAGAHEQKRREREMAQAAARAAAGTKRLSLPAEIAASVSRLPPPPIPVPLATVSSHPVLRAVAEEPANISRRPAQSVLVRQFEASKLIAGGLREAG
jgi:hypothetical protein